ncbi:YdeI/OmpD-associated family protein [Daejeonella sp.]|uniref:YdeI/OmpD-associated family protein n=1 Tax=Daejeonella sp. TaxID=2805397 RepID=UPI003983898D
MEPITFPVFLEPIDEKMVHHLIVVPDEIAKGFLNGKGAPRIFCSVNGGPEFPCALNPRNGRYVIIASKQLIKKNRLYIDVLFEISIRNDPNNGLGRPEELNEVLDQDETAFQAYNALNDGHKRGYIYYVSQAKSVDSRIKRSLEIVEKIKKSGMLKVDRGQLEGEM